MSLNIKVNPKLQGKLIKKLIEEYYREHKTKLPSECAYCEKAAIGIVSDVPVCRSCFSEQY